MDNTYIFITHLSHFKNSLEFKFLEQKIKSFSLSKLVNTIVEQLGNNGTNHESIAARHQAHFLCLLNSFLEESMVPINETNLAESLEQWGMLTLKDSQYDCLSTMVAKPFDNGSRNLFYLSLIESLYCDYGLKTGILQDQKGIIDDKNVHTTKKTVDPVIPSPEQMLNDIKHVGAHNESIIKNIVNSLTNKQEEPEQKGDISQETDASSEKNNNQLNIDKDETYSWDNPKKGAYPAKWYALYHLILLRLGKTNALKDAIDSRGQSGRAKEIKEYAQKKYGVGEGFYKCIDEINISTDKAVELFIKYLKETWPMKDTKYRVWKEIILDICNRDGDISAWLHNKPN